MTNWEVVEPPEGSEEVENAMLLPLTLDPNADREFEVLERTPTQRVVDLMSEIGAEALRLSETGADRLAFKQFTRPSTRCVGCGACSCVCPTGAIKVMDTQDGRRQTIFTGTVVREHQLVACTDCDQKYAAPAYLEHLKRRVGPAAVPHVELGICPSCARRRRASELAGTPFFNFAST